MSTDERETSGDKDSVSVGKEVSFFQGEDPEGCSILKTIVRIESRIGIERKRSRAIQGIVAWMGRLSSVERGIQFNFTFDRYRLKPNIQTS